ncbi:hypothetical protein POM88_044488 [Heracleum sosnowskyi]|uniref:Ubiquitin-like protease family profile domain-containing protein n=1 Tax=Heracleum sosnowskyi TaxID=360622 RepID=A0AAD8H5G9_9APIA|nr:hypothetical protein POM88_044488 [Heracleum sosnowskyi]
MSGKQSCQKVQVESPEIKSKPAPVAKELLEELDCVAVDPTTPETKGPRSCELAVDSIDNIVAFEFRMIGQAAISSYMSYLHNVMPLEDALKRALRTFNSQTGRGNRTPKVQNLAGSPKQPGSHECGYVVMRYMRDIILDEDMYSFSTKWFLKTRTSYKIEELEEDTCTFQRYPGALGIINAISGHLDSSSYPKALGLINAIPEHLASSINPKTLLS